MGCAYVYSLATGEILYMLSPAPADPTLPTGQGIVYVEASEMDGPAKYYIQDGNLELRPEMSLTVSSAVLVDSPWSIAGIPAGTTVKYPDGTLVVDDGFIEWSSAVAGTFRFRLNCFPYLEREIYATITET